MRSIYDASVMYVHVRPAYEFRRGFCTLVLYCLMCGVCVCVAALASFEIMILTGFLVCIFDKNLSFKSYGVKKPICK